MKTHTPLSRLMAFLAVAGVAACTDQAATDLETGPQFARSAAMSPAAAEIAAHMDALNVSLAEDGADYRIAMAEYITGDEGDEAGNTVLAKNIGNKRLGFQFIPNDPRRGWSGDPAAAVDNVTYAIDQTGDAVPVFGGLTATDTDASISNAMMTWDGLQCSNLQLTRNPDFGIDIGLVAFILSGGVVGSPFVFADVQHAGWRDLNFAGGVLGVAYTFGFTDANGFTDVDGDGYLDTAFREIYYDPSFAWATDGNAASGIDVESIALHEAGHGLSQAHFGTVSIRNSGALAASPRAVMNALYSAPLRELQGTDDGGHCASWANWGGGPE